MPTPIKVVLYAKFGSPTQEEVHTKALEKMLFAYVSMVENAHQKNSAAYQMYKRDKDGDGNSVDWEIRDVLQRYYNYCKAEGIEKGSVKRFAESQGILLV